MTSEPTAESCARSRLEKRSIELEQQHGHYAMFAAWREWFVEWNARQPEAIHVDDILDETLLFAMCCEFMSSKPDPTYTMQQAIDKIVDGLVLAWEDDGPRGRINQDWNAVRRGVKYRVIQFHDRIVCITPLVNIVVDSVLAGKDICLSEVKREFRTEIEKAVKL